MGLRLLLTGATGRFGATFRPMAQAAGHDVVACGPQGEVRFDITAPKPPRLGHVRPDWVVHAAALTDVDACERDPAKAGTMNAEATAVLAAAATAAGARFLQVSTDYVFDGARGGYDEEDPTGPLSVYGRTKLAGEAAALAQPGAVVARTCVVFGTPGKPDFVAWAAQQVREGKPMRIVHQRISPTSTPDLAAQILALVAADAEGVYHTAGADPLTRLEMVQAIGRILGKAPIVQEIPLSEMGWPAPRPLDSSLSVKKMARLRAPMAFVPAARAYLEGLA